MSLWKRRQRWTTFHVAGLDQPVLISDGSCLTLILHGDAKNVTLRLREPDVIDVLFNATDEQLSAADEATIRAKYGLNPQGGSHAR